MAVLSAGLLAVCARLSSLVSTLLCGYLALVLTTAGVVLVLSPAREVTPTGLVVAEAVVLLATTALWWARGRPRLSLVSARSAARGLLTSRPTALFFVAVLLLLGYELVLGFTFPPNDWDSLTYHLARVASWTQFGGVHWIANAPTDRMNEFQPLAEEELFFLMVAGGSALIALPQFVAGVAILVAVYGASRRLGFTVSSATGAACLLATFSVIALEASTAENDVFAASFPIVAACLLLDRSDGFEAFLAGAAAGIGLGAKLTTVLVLPILVWLACLGGRRRLLGAITGGAAGFAALAFWSFALNAIHTGHLLGNGGGRTEFTAAPSYPATVESGIDLIYGALGPAAISHTLTFTLAAFGLLVAAGATVYAVRRRRSAPHDVAAAAGPFLVPVLVLGIGAAVVGLVRLWGHPAPQPASIDFGALGGFLWFAVSVFAIVRYVQGRVDQRQLALAVAGPLYIVLLVLYATYNPVITRFLLVPVALTAPLFAHLFRTHVGTAALSVVAAVVAVAAVVLVWNKPIDSADGWFWQISQPESLALHDDADVAAALTAYNSLVPPRACVGVLFAQEDPSYLLYGSQLVHHIVYLPNIDPPDQARNLGLTDVVIGRYPETGNTSGFQSAGWTIRDLGTVWQLASRPASGTVCRS